MYIVLFSVLLATIAVLSKPGRMPGLAGLDSGVNYGKLLLIQRGIAIALMLVAIIPALAGEPAWIRVTKSTLVAIGIISVMVPFLAWLIVMADKRGNESGIAELAGSYGGVISYIAITAAYMTSYEILVRGMLLSYLTERLEVVYAVLINSLIYALMHIFKNRREALLSFPLGIFLCWLTIYTESVWSAACFHTAMALSFELYYTYRTHRADVIS